MISRTSRQKKAAGRATFVSVRCEKSTQEGSGVDVWIGRLAMVAFAGAISVEIATGKGLLEVWHALIMSFNVSKKKMLTIDFKNHPIPLSMIHYKTCY